MGTEGQALDRKLLDALERLGEAFRVLKNDIARDHGLSALQIRVMTQLLRNGNENPSSSELAREFGITRATTGEVTKKLQNKELLVRQRSSDDRRRYGLQLTRKGKELAEELSGYMDMLQAPLEEMERSEKETLLRSSLSIIHGLIRRGVVSVQRMCYTCRFYRQEKGEAYCELLDLVMDEPRVDCETHETAKA